MTTRKIITVGVLLLVAGAAYYYFFIKADGSEEPAKPVNDRPGADPSAGTTERPGTGSLSPVTDRPGANTGGYTLYELGLAVGGTGSLSASQPQTGSLTLG